MSSNGTVLPADGSWKPMGKLPLISGEGEWMDGEWMDGEWFGSTQ